MLPPQTPDAAAAPDPLAQLQSPPQPQPGAAPDPYSAPNNPGAGMAAEPQPGPAAGPNPGAALNPALLPEPADLADEQAREDARRMADLARKLVDYMVPLEAPERLLLGKNLRYEIDRYREATEGRRQNLVEWRRDWEMAPAADSGRWDGAANVNSFLTHLYCASHTTRLNQQIVGSDEYVTVDARKPAAVNAAPIIQEALQASLDEASFRQKAQDLHIELPIAGNCFLRVTYEEVYRRRPVTRLESDEGILGSLLQGGAQPSRAYLESVKTDRQGRPKVTLEWVEELKSAGVEYEVIPWEYGIVLPATVRKAEQARGIGERISLTGSELRAGVKQGKYYADAVDELLQRSADPIHEDRFERLEDQGISAGTPTEPEDQDPLFRSYDCYELCYLYDANGDELEEWCIVTVHYDTAAVLRCQYLPYEHGESYYHLIGYIRRPGELWAMSIAELLTAIQDAHTALLNQLIDSGDLVLNRRGNYWYEKSSGHKPDQYVVDLSKPIPVDSVQGILQMEVTPLSPEHYQMLGMLKDMGDLLTASSNPSLGQVTDNNKTLGEVQIVQAASQLIFEEIAGGVALQLARVWDQHRWLIAQYGEGGKVRYRKAADPGLTIAGADGQAQSMALVQGVPQPATGGYAFGVVDAETLLQDVDMTPTGLHQLADINSRIQQVLLVIQQLMAIPAAGPSSPKLQLMLVDKHLQAVRWTNREEVMAELWQTYQANLAAQALELRTGKAAAEAGGQVQGQEDANTANQADERHQSDLQADQAAQPPAPGSPEEALPVIQ